MDRRLTQIIEEMPSKLQREIKNIEARDSNLWKDSQAKQATLIETVTKMRDLIKIKNSEVNERIQSM